MAECRRPRVPHERPQKIAMDVALPFIGVWAVWSMVGWRAVTMRSGILRKGVVLSMVVTACSLVFWLWEHSDWLRGLAVIPVLLLLGKSWMIGVRSVPWLTEPVKAGPFALWCVVLPEGVEVRTRWSGESSPACDARGASCSRQGVGPGPLGAQRPRRTRDHAAHPARVDGRGVLPLLLMLRMFWASSGGCSA